MAAQPAGVITEGFKVVGHIYGLPTPVRNIVLGGTVSYGDILVNAAGVVTKAGVAPTVTEVIGLALKTGGANDVIPVAVFLPGLLLSAILITNASEPTPSPSAAAQRYAQYTIGVDSTNQRQCIDTSGAGALFTVIAFDDAVIVGTTTRPKVIVTPCQAATIFGS